MYSGNFLAACLWIYSISTSKPGICFLNFNNLFLGVVVFVDLWSDEEVDETWEEKWDVKGANKVIHIFSLYRAVLSGMFLPFGAVGDDYDEHLNLNIHFCSQMYVFKW